MTGTATDAGSPLGRLIGTWDFEASSGGRFLGRGVATFEWAENGAFVIERADDELDPATSEDWATHSPMPVTAILGLGRHDRRDRSALLRRSRRLPRTTA